MLSTIDKVGRIEEIIAHHYARRVELIQSLRPVAARHGITVLDLPARGWRSDDAYDLVVVLIGNVRRGPIAVFSADTDLEGPPKPELTKKIDDASYFCLNDIRVMKPTLTRLVSTFRVQDATVSARVWTQDAYTVYLKLLRDLVDNLDTLADG